MIGWITDKFKGLNKILDKWLGWLKNKNKELSDEIKGFDATTESTINQTVTGKTVIENPVINQEQPVVSLSEPRKTLYNHLC